MSSSQRGTTGLRVEVTSVSSLGVRILVDGRELFAPFTEFPWFRDATIAQILRVERPAPDHLYWPDLDVDLSVESIENPGAYPRVYQSERSNRSGA
jgi:hypothetical protein